MIERFKMSYSAVINMPLKVRVCVPWQTPLYKAGHHTLEELFGLERNELGTLYPGKHICTVKQIPEIAEELGKRLPCGALFFSRDVQPCWLLTPTNELHQITTAAAWQWSTEHDVPMYMLVMHRGCGRKQFHILTPARFEVVVTIPKIWCERASKTFLIDMTEIHATIPSLELWDPRPWSVAGLMLKIV